MNDVLWELKSKLLRRYPIFGSIIVNLEFVIDDSIYSNGIPTCGTNGKKVAFHSKYIENAPDSELLYMGAHEVAHVALEHLLRREDKEFELWNYVCDAVLNQLLKKDGIEIPKGSIDEIDAVGYSAEDYYEKLVKENSAHKRNYVGLDTHSMWVDARIFSENQIKGKEIIVIDEQKIFEINAKERDKQLKQMMSEFKQIASQGGSNTSSELISLENLGRAEKIVDWRFFLREALALDVDWSYQNAEIEYGIITPKLTIFSKPETEILLDTSASITDDLLKGFLRECKNILEQSRVNVGCFDTEFYGFTEIKTMEDIENLKFVGRGGTDFNVAVDAFSERVENKIIFTDGKASMPNENMDVIWVVCGDKLINPPGGRVIYISVEQLQELSVTTKNQIKVEKTR